MYREKITFVCVRTSKEKYPVKEFNGQFNRVWLPLKKKKDVLVKSCVHVTPDRTRALIEIKTV